MSLSTNVPKVWWKVGFWCAILIFTKCKANRTHMARSSSTLLFNQVAWFVSNCHPRNQRMHYARELSKYIQVDIYGACGSLRCPRSQSQTCFDMLDEDYKFYLAFENSNCKDYITEKFFVNGLGYVCCVIFAALSRVRFMRPTAVPWRALNVSRPNARSFHPEVGNLCQLLWHLE